MRAIAIAIGLVAAHGIARADDAPPPPPHATGFMLELRYSPELDVPAYPISNNFISLGYLDRRFAFAVTFGLNRVTSDDPNGGGSLSTTYLTIGPTVRGSFFETADGTTELVGEGTATYTSVGMDTDNSDAIGTPSPLRFELGIGVRHWIVPELAIGASALVRYTTAQVGPQSLTQESLGGALYLTGAL
jgi:hypothetical protein